MQGREGEEAKREDERKKDEKRVEREHWTRLVSPSSPACVSFRLVLKALYLPFRTGFLLFNTLRTSQNETQELFPACRWLFDFNDMLALCKDGSLSGGEERGSRTLDLVSPAGRLL